MSYDCQIRLRGRPWYQAARRVSLGYELDPAENRGFLLTIPAYLVAEEVLTPSSVAQLRDAYAPSRRCYRPPLGADHPAPSETVHRQPRTGMPGVRGEAVQPEQWPH